MKRSCCIFILSVLTLLNGVAQDVNVSTSFDTTTIYMGDQLSYKITVEQPADMVLSLTQLKDTICNKIEILAGPVVDTVVLDNKRLQITNDYLVTSFDTGYYRVKPVYAQLSNDQGQQRFYSGYSFLEVLRVNIAPADTSAVIYDIVEPFKAPVTVEELVPWFLLAILVCLAIFGIYKLIYFIAKRNLVKAEMEPEKPKEPAHIIAFRELDELKNAELWQKGDIKGYYTRLTEIIRQYLDNRYGVSSMELTTPETLMALTRVGFKKDENYTNLKMLLDSSDLVKFAKHKPVNDEHQMQFERTHRFVEDTMEKPTVNVETDAKNGNNSGTKSNREKEVQS